MNMPLSAVFNPSIFTVISPVSGTIYGPKFTSQRIGKSHLKEGYSAWNIFMNDGTFVGVVHSILGPAFWQDGNVTVCVEGYAEACRIYDMTKLGVKVYSK